MTKKKLPVRFTGQHFTIDKVLIKDAIRQANISNQDTVLDIGAGKGFLTVHLLKIANNVVAIENDTALVEHLRKLFSDARNVQVVVWGIERSGFFNGREKWAKGFENQRV